MIDFNSNFFLPRTANDDDYSRTIESAMTTETIQKGYFEIFF